MIGGLQKRRPAFPKRMVCGAILTMSLMLCAATYLTAGIGTRFLELSRSQAAVKSATEELKHLEQIADLSLRGALASPDPSFAARYQAAQPKLRATLVELQGALKASGAGSNTAAVEKADDPLLAAQQQALVLAQSGNVEAARQIVEGPRYGSLLSAYYSRISEIEDGADRFIGETDRQLQWLLRADIALTIFAFGMILLGWMAILKPAALWGQRLKHALEDSECLARQLEIREAELEALARARREPSPAAGFGRSTGC